MLLYLNCFCEAIGTIFDNGVCLQNLVFLVLWRCQWQNAKRFECCFLHFLVPFSPSFHAAIPSEAIPVLVLCTLHQHWLIDSLKYRKLHATMCWLLDMELFMEWTMSDLSLWQHECTLRLIDIRPGNPCGMSAAFVACSLDATIFSSFWMFFLTCSFFVELFKELDLDSLILMVCMQDILPLTRVLYVFT